ncbi:MAG TPA: hypothetical protein VEI83_05600 [Acidimicrobiales bacterium]|nr:hypothetical protein [Acidimicrobiales bacterium]
MTVTHPVTLGQDAGLGFAYDLTITGPVTLGDSSALFSLGGNLHIGGPVTVGPNALFTPYFSSGPPWPSFTLDGGVTVENQGAFFVQAGSTIHGPVTATDPSAINIVGSQLSGPVRLQGGGGPNGVLASLHAPASNYTWSVLQWNKIAGPVTIQGYAGVTVLVEGNTIAGALTVTGNTQLVGWLENPGYPPYFPVAANTFFVQGNTIRGNANCSNNGTATLLQDYPQGFTGPNTVYGHIDTCE